MNLERLKTINRKYVIYGAAACAVFLFSFMLLFDGCAPSKPYPVLVGGIPDNEMRPEKWGEVYPLEYKSWLKTKEPREKGKSRYKRGWDTDRIVWDKLSEFPFMALLFNGFGFGVEYNESRGHFYMMIDQREIDQSRTKAGGACLACKSPYVNKFYGEMGKDLFKLSYADAVGKIPKEHQDLGVACIDCHDNKTMDLKAGRWTVKSGLKSLGREEFSRQEMRSIVCGQCHVTYYIPKDDKGGSTDVVFPWAGSTWGNISMENIIKVLLSNPANREWKQAVTGFKLPFIRHPEFEFFTMQSTHFKAGLSCADCHMPYRREGGFKISDHNIMSPLKDDLHACSNCHPQSKDRIRDLVFAIQDRTVSLMNRAGYSAASTAKLFELVHQQQAAGKTINNALYAKAKEFYEEALLRGIYIGAENSIGFHNPTEAGRILGDSIAFSMRAEALLRQALTQAGVEVPEAVRLELPKYLNNRGSKQLNFQPLHELKDPYGIQDRLLPALSKGI